MALKQKEMPVRRYGKMQNEVKLPDLLAVQKDSYEWFLQRNVLTEKRKYQGLQSIFEETFPIVDTNGKFVLEFKGYTIGAPKRSENDCKERGLTYSAPLKAKISLVVKDTGEVREQMVFFGDIPLMTDRGSFIVNGSERVIVSQLHRSPGVLFDADPNERMFTARIIPYHGSWLDFELDATCVMYVRIDRKKKISAATFMKAFGYDNSAILKEFVELETIKLKNLKDADLNCTKYPDNKKLCQLFAEDLKNAENNSVVCHAGDEVTRERIGKLESLGVDSVSVTKRVESAEENVIVLTLMQDEKETKEDALLKIFKILRPNDPTTPENVVNEFNRVFFSNKRYNLGKVGRYKINRKLGMKIDENKTTLDVEDVKATIRYLVNILLDRGTIDDIDSLANRRIKSVGELLYNQMRMGFIKMEKMIKDKMAIQALESSVVNPHQLINVKPISSQITDFFHSNQLSQFMDQTNPLAELRHKRRISALGAGGLSRERAGFKVRDVHPTHYGRVCPIETPEGPNIGLILSLSTYARVNEYGLIETPYRKVRSGMVHDKIEFLTAAEEYTGKMKDKLDDGEVSKDGYRIAQANVRLEDKTGKFVDPLVPGRYKGDLLFFDSKDVDYIDVSPKQLVSVATALIPFLEHDDANRALMGSNMQGQAVPLLACEKPLIGTGIEGKVILDSGSAIVAQNSGKCVYVSAEKIIIQKTGDKIDAKTGEILEEGLSDEYDLIKYQKSNSSTCISQKPVAKKGQKVNVGDVIADGPASSNGILSLGRNILVAFMPWEGYNFEDAIVLSEKMVKEDFFTSVHIEEFEVETRDTKLGKESITRDIPSLEKESLANLDETGKVRIGVEVASNDILVGKVTPKGEQDLTPEYNLLYSIFGEKAKDVRDTSLRLKHGKEGIVIDVKHFSRNEDYEMPQGVEELVKVGIAIKRKVGEGDKMAGRHGNKGVISKVLPEEDMPFMEDGTPIEIVLNPLSVPSRMNLGQILETHMGWAAHKLGFYVETPVFDGAVESEIRELLKQAGLPENGKTKLRDGRTGDYFDQEVTVGYIYMMKLCHLVADKVHARSTGPYSLVTQQPLGGKAQFGGQRMGEMEVWALEAYGAANLLQELLTVKSDDIVGRTRMYEAIVKGENALPPGIPESFNVMVRELQGLALNVEVWDEDSKLIQLKISDEDFRRKSTPGIEVEKLFSSTAGRGEKINEEL